MTQKKKQSVHDLTMTPTDERGWWLDASGIPCHESHVQPGDKLAEDLVRVRAKKALRLSRNLRDFKADLMKQVDRYMKQVGGKWDTDDWAGNITISNYSNTLKVVIKKQDRVEFDEKIGLAKKKVDKFIREHESKVHKDIMAIINHTFNVDKEGSYDKKRLIQFRQINIDHPLIKDAKQLLTEAEQVVGTKKYIQIFMKPGMDPEAEYEAIPLSISQV